MNAVKTFTEIMQDTQKIESIDLKGFLETGSINIKLKNLTDQEKEDLEHLRISNVSGAIFDDREV